MSLWKTFEKCFVKVSKHVVAKVCLTCHGKRSDWFEKMTIGTNIDVLGRKRDHREIWWSGRGALAWLAIEHLQPSIIQFCAVELELSSFLKWKYITFCIGNVFSFKVCKRQISTHVWQSQTWFPWKWFLSIHIQNVKRHSTRRCSNSNLHQTACIKLCDGKSICNSDRCTEFDGSGANNQIQWIPREHLKFLKVLHYPMFHKSRTDL